MGSSKRQWEQEQEERLKKQEALLDLPEDIEETRIAVEVMAERLESSAVEIFELRQKLSNASSTRNRLLNGVFGFLIGCASSLVVWYFTKD